MELENLVYQDIDDIYQTVNQRYRDLYEYIVSTGRYVNTRYGETDEILSAQFECPAGTILHRSGQNLKISWCETIQLVAGLYDANAFKIYAPKSDQSLFTRSMAYGPRTVGSLSKIIDALKDNPDSRQAYLFIGRPGEECSENLPCTLGLQFLVRNGVVHANAFMRSLDILKGLPVDVAMFGALIQIVANCLDLIPGSMIVTAGSGHVYVQDRLAEKLPVVPGKVRTFELPKFSTHKEYVKWAVDQSFWRWERLPEGIIVEEVV